MHKSLSYRPEIDGLRTLAVLAVIIFHLDGGALKGGFLGVDVFFVISGYLITTIIASQLQEGTFSFWSFWKRRIKRLYPALLVVVAASMLIGAFILVEPERGNLPGQALAAIFSYQNINLWLTTGGYWSQAAENILLLHTWSLSLEEQFYVLFPLILFVLIRWVKRWQMRVLAGLLLASLALCIYATPVWRNASFYLLPMRMWELMFGSLLAMRHLRAGVNTHSKAAPLFQTLGLGLIVASFIAIENGERFPGFWPIFPCLGTLLILKYGSAQGWVKSLLSLKPVVYIGKISYSLYLWHWVVIVTARYISTEALYVEILAITFVCAIASYHLVECPFRYGLKRPRLVLPLAGAALASCVLPILLLPSSPLLKDLGNINAKEARAIGSKFSALKAWKKGEPGVWGNQGDAVDICVLGSSHARVWCPPIAHYAQERGLSMLSMANSRLGILSLDESMPDVSTLKGGHVFHQKRMAKLLELRPKVVILGGKWSGEIPRCDDYLEIFVDHLRLMTEAGAKVVIIGEVPYMDMPARYHYAIQKYLVAKNFEQTLDEITAGPKAQQANQQIQEAIAKAGLANVTFIDPTQVFTNEKGFLKAYEEQTLLYYDNNHLNEAGTTYGFQQLLKEPLDRIFPAAL